MFTIEMSKNNTKETHNRPTTKRQPSARATLLLQNETENSDTTNHRTRESNQQLPPRTTTDSIKLMINQESTPTIGIRVTP